MRIYFIRHGETAWNRKLKIQGQADIPLNSAGKKQASLAAGKLAMYPVDIAYTSPLKRARETAEIMLARRSDCPLYVNPLLKEISYGVREGQSLFAIRSCPFFRLHTYFAHPEKYIPPTGGETIPELKVRCQKFLNKEILCLDPKISGIMVFTHGAFIRAAIGLINQIPDRDFWAGPELKNCEIVTCELENGRLGLISAL
ncbi:MAG: histidine phosphatase family protein [Treponema sp.]|jgi:probable phosphoglycerate mutase|nr:histidine phosphatase family protein [Treponema sp.]